MNAIEIEARRHLDVTLMRRNHLIRELWATYSELCKLLDEDAFTDEDLEMWNKITAHSAVQSALKEQKNGG